MYQTGSSYLGSSQSYGASAASSSYLQSTPETTYLSEPEPASQLIPQESLHHEEIMFSPSPFVNKHTCFVNTTEDIQRYVEEAHLATTDRPLPSCSIKLCDKEELKFAHHFFNGTWSEGIQGFCINRKDTPLIFVKKDELAKVLLTIGHELGHIQTTSLGGVEEEAKAFAFSMAWMDAIRRNDIANLQDAYVKEQPARNGLHNVAFSFVLDMLSFGKNALDVFSELIHGRKVETFKYGATS